jgi:3'(2'), 5'-bisphosphate nucleotidase
MIPDPSTEIGAAVEAAEEAARQILRVYESGDFKVERKDDLSPLSVADRRAHTAIVNALEKTGLPMLSEEGARIPYEQRKLWTRFWMVDPLDGTKEFLKRNGEFTVNIALLEGNEPVLGVVTVPVTGQTYFAVRGKGAFLREKSSVQALARRKSADRKRRGLRVIASRSHMSAETQQFLSTLDHPELVSSGSSLKFMLVATGEADLYPRFAPTMEWDTAAAHAIVNEVGLGVYQDLSSEPLTYNKPDLMNPHFVCG